MAAGRSPGRTGNDVELALESGAAATQRAGYHAVPASGRGRAALVLDEDLGLGDFARDACDRLARAGFVALALEAGGASQPGALLDAGVQYLLDDDRSDGARVGAVGFGRGGGLALDVGRRNRRVGCVIDFYGLCDPELPEPEVPLPVRALLIFGQDDPRTRDGEALALRDRLGEARLQIEPDAGEGFMNAARGERHAAAAAAAGWDAAIAFLGDAL